MIFEGFTLAHIPVEGGSIRLRHGGSGPPLLLHGNPQTHAMWHAVAPDLAQRFTIICPERSGSARTRQGPSPWTSNLNGFPKALGLWWVQGKALA